MLLAAGALLTAAAGATAAPPKLGDWCRTTSAALELVSDLPQAEARALLELLERFAPVAEPFLPGAPVARPVPLRILVFARARDFRTVTGKPKFAGLMQPSLDTNRLLIGPVRGDITSTAQHEYAHYLLRNRLDISLPAWFDEGLASLLGATSFSADSARIGRLPVSRIRARINAPTASQALRRVLQVESVEDFPRRSIEEFYDWAWLLAHYLYLGPWAEDANRLDNLTGYLEHREADLPGYLGTSNHGLVRDLRRYLDRQLPGLDVPSTAVTGAAPGFECLSETERNLELAAAVTSYNPALVEALLAPLEPTAAMRPEVLVTRSRAALAAGDLSASTRFGEQALAADPHSANAIINSADIAINDCLFSLDDACLPRWQQAGTAYRQALKLDPERFDAVMGLGLSYLYTGRPGEAVNYLRVVYGRAPWSPMVNYYLGESYRLIGDDQARRFLVNARNWAVLPIWQALAIESLSRLP